MHDDLDILLDPVDGFGVDAAEKIWCEHWVAGVDFYTIVINLYCGCAGVDDSIIDGKISVRLDGHMIT